MAERQSLDHRQSFLQRHQNSDLSHQYDYVIVFPMVGPPENLEQSPVAKYVVKTMIDAGLEIFSYMSIQSDELIVLVRCPLPKMQDFADEIDFMMELDRNELKKTLETGVPDPEKGENAFKIQPVSINEDPKYSSLSPYAHIYGKYGTDLNENLYYVPSTSENHTAFTKAVRLKLIYYILRAPRRKGGCDIELSKLVYNKKVLAFFPLHDRDISDQLVSKIMEVGEFPWTIPFTEYKDYFGEKIALYAKFMGHYSYWLIFPGIIGLIFQLVVWGTVDFSSPVLPFYGLIITIWSILMLEYWKREEKKTALEWGMTDFEQQEQDRPEFQGETITSFIDGSQMVYYPPSESQMARFSSQAVVTGFVMLVIGVVASIYVLRFSIQSDVGTYASVIASVLNTVQITVFNIIYQDVSVLLTDAENHRTDTQYEDSMIVKLFIFQFINSYASFFYLAFIAQYLDRPDGASDDYQGQCGYSDCMQPLSINLAIIFGTRLTFKNFLDIFIPWLQYKAKFKKETSGVENPGLLTPPELDYILMNYNNVLEGIKNYADCAIQYGFSLLFVTALPSAPFFSLISNYVKVKFNVWKQATFYQRPVPTGAQDIGTWQLIFQILSVAAVITNAALVCFTMDIRGMEDYTPQGRVWIFIGFQWVLISIQFLAAEIVVDETEEVQIQRARMQFITSKVIDQQPDDFSGVQGTAEIAVAEVEDTGNMFNCCKKHGKRLETKFNVEGIPRVEVSVYPHNATAGNPILNMPETDTRRPSLATEPNPMLRPSSGN